VRSWWGVAKPGRLQRRWRPRRAHSAGIVDKPRLSGFASHLHTPGQTPEDFAAHASAIAYDLGVVQVRVVTLETPLIRLQLWAKPTLRPTYGNFSDPNTCTFLLGGPKDHDKEALVR